MTLPAAMASPRTINYYQISRDMKKLIINLLEPLVSNYQHKTQPISIVPHSDNSDKQKREDKTTIQYPQKELL